MAKIHATLPVAAAVLAAPATWTAHQQERAGGEDAGDLPVEAS